MLRHCRRGALVAVFIIACTGRGAAQVDDDPKAVVDADAASRRPFELSAAGNGLVLVEPNTTALVARGGSVTLRPAVPLATTANINAYINGELAEVRNVSAGDAPAVTLEADRRGGTKRVLLQATTLTGGTVNLGRFIIRADVDAPAFTVTRQGEAAELRAPTPLKGCYVFVDRTYAGFTRGSSVRVDCRRLAPGPHPIRVVPLFEDGTLGAVGLLPVTVEQRYTALLETKEAVLTVPNYDADVTVGLKASLRPGTGIETTSIYVAGHYLTDVSGDAMTVTVPLRRVPTGVSHIVFVGHAKDGTTYAEETLPFRVRNQDWEIRIGTTPEYRAILGKQAEVNALTAEAAYWLPKAQNESRFILQREASKSFDIATMTMHRQESTTITPNGKYGEYVGEWARCLARIAQLYFDIGGLYRSLGLAERARDNYSLCIRVAGLDAPIGVRAQGCIRALMSAPPRP